VFRFELIRKYLPSYENDSRLPEKLRNAYRLSIHFKDWNQAADLDLGKKEADKNLPELLRFNDYLLCYVSNLLITDKKK